MKFQPSIRIWICVFLASILIGVASYSYSTIYSWQEPITTYEYTTVQKSRYVPVYDDIISNSISPADAIYFGPYYAVTNPFDTIAFNIPETDWATYLIIKGVANGDVWWNTSTNHSIKYVSVWSNDTYSIEIHNLHASQPLFMRGRINVFRTEYYTELVPFPVTTYQTKFGTEYPYRSLGAILVFIGILAGIGTGVFILQSKRRMKEIGIN